MIKATSKAVKIEGSVVAILAEASTILEKVREIAIEKGVEKQFASISKQIIDGIPSSEIRFIPSYCDCKDINSEYFVFIEGTGMPTVKHKSYKEADDELERLLMIKNNAGRTGYVCKIDMAKKSVVEVKEVGDL